MAGDVPGTAPEDTAPEDSAPDSSAAGPGRPAGPAAPLALYRRYRPATFAEVRGQEHVTEPLAQALRSGRVHHAYLFSGPRGCGKTSSARILARSLNCEQGPTPDPCGTCPSCMALAPSGPGSIDVIEIDAASHGGVDDARDLRERAFYAPVAGRYKIYIIDEAHMVTREGFNALLKLVEEPPPHLKFVFATTEPEKVIPTIRSRTHHYPFRLLPPAVLRGLLEEVLAREGIRYEPAVLPLVVRAGAGSARDALSVLDQLLAGADDTGLSYERTLALLGYTDDRLLDDMVEAFAAGDGAAVFSTVDKVVEAGHDPRRFAADLLDRCRDLIILAAVPAAGQTGLLDVPADRLERMAGQAERFGQAALTRAAQIISEGLAQMRGTTSPRLLLELMCAQVLLPGADASESALLARVERLERRLETGRARSAGQAAGETADPGRDTGQPRGEAAQPRGEAAQPPGGAAGPRGGAPGPGVRGQNEEAGRAAPPAAGSTRRPRQAPRDESPARQPAGQGGDGRIPPAGGGPVTGPGNGPAQGPGGGRVRGTGGPAAEPGGGEAPAPGPRQAAGQVEAPVSGPRQAAGQVDAELVRQRWPEILEAVKGVRRVAWMLLSNATVHSLEDGVLIVGFAREGEARGFAASGYDQDLIRVLASVLGVRLRVRALAGVPPGGQFGGRPGPGQGTGRQPARPGSAGASGPAAGPGRAAGPGPAGGEVPASGAGTGPDGRGNGGPRGRGPTGTPGHDRAAASQPGVSSPPDAGWPDDWPGEPSGPSGAMPAPQALSGMDLITRQLGGQVIEEIEGD
jgi:DNA polymerase-3 subunit gamma/tau